MRRAQNFNNTIQLHIAANAIANATCVSRCLALRIEGSSSSKHFFVVSEPLMKAPRG